MASTVFANNREVSCKAADGKTICAFPDVCFTPPENPATPPGVPVPYPNTGLASDTTDGSKTVKIGGKEVGLKDKSCFKKSMGDEAGCAAKKGIITSQNRGKLFQELVDGCQDRGRECGTQLDEKRATMPLIQEIRRLGHTLTLCPFPPTLARMKKLPNRQPVPNMVAIGTRNAPIPTATAQACKLVPYGGSGSPNCCSG